MNPIIKEITANQVKKDIPPFKVGDGVRVHTKVREGDKERIQIFSGIVIARKGRVSTRRSPCAGSATARASSACFRSIPEHRDHRDRARVRAHEGAPLLPARPPGQGRGGGHGQVEHSDSAAAVPAAPASS